MNEFIKTVLITNILWAILACCILLIISKSKTLRNRDKLNLLYTSYIGLPIVVLFQFLQANFTVETYLPASLQVYSFEIVKAVSKQSETIVPIVPLIVSIAIIGILYLIHSLRKLFKIHIDEVDTFSSMITDLQQKTAFNKPIKVYSTTWFKTPFSFGWLKKRIIIPQSMISKISDNRMVFVLLHEMIHIVHHDYIKNVIQKTIRVLFFFNPFAHILDKHIDNYREFACDEDVLTILPNKQDYAQTLLDLHQENIENIVLAHQFLSDKDGLRNRIKALSNSNPIHKNKRIHLNVFVLLSFVLIACQKDLAEMDLVEPDYVEYNLTQTKPQILKKVFPKYPQMAQKDGIEGMVVIDFIVDKTGLPKDLKVIKGIPLLNDAAISAIEQYRFKPGENNGQPVDVKWRVPVRFKLHDYDKQEFLSPSNYKNPDGDAGLKIWVPSYVDKKPELIQSASPEYPKDAIEQKISGKVYVEFVIDKNGIPLNAHVTSGPKALWDSAKEAIIQFRFKPAEKDGNKVNVWWKLPFEYTLYGLNEVKLLDYEPIPDRIYNSGPDMPAVASEIYSYSRTQDKPKIIKKVDPKYPELAQKNGIEGRVVVTFIVSKTGQVLKPIVYANNSVPELDQAAIDAISQYEFEPGKINGKAVNVEMKIPIVFKLKGNTESPDKTEDFEEIYNERHLKEKPVILKQVLPKYPKNAMDKNISGTIIVDFTVNKEGIPTDLSIFESHSIPELDQAALDAIKQYRFKPITVEGKLVNVRMSIPVKFVLN